ASAARQGNGLHAGDGAGARRAGGLGRPGGDRRRPEEPQHHGAARAARPRAQVGLVTGPATTRLPARGGQRSGGMPFTSSRPARQIAYSTTSMDSSGLILASPISSAPIARRSISIERVIFWVCRSTRTRRGGLAPSRPTQTSPVLVQPAGNGERSPWML